MVYNKLKWRKVLGTERCQKQVSLHIHTLSLHKKHNKNITKQYAKGSFAGESLSWTVTIIITIKKKHLTKAIKASSKQTLQNIKVTTFKACTDIISKCYFKKW